MKLRQTLSIGLAKHWIKEEALKEQDVTSCLAKFDVEDKLSG